MLMPWLWNVLSNSTIISVHIFKGYSTNRALLRIFGRLKHCSMYILEWRANYVCCKTVYLSFTVSFCVITNVWRIKASFLKYTGCLIQPDIGITKIAVWKFYFPEQYHFCIFLMCMQGLNWWITRFFEYTDRVCELPFTIS